MTDFQMREWSFDVAATGTVRNISSSFDVATLIIQNPSGMWLYLPAMRQYVPPQSLGVVIPIIPTSKSINIQYVNAPTGGLPSAVSGGPIIIDAYSTEMAAYQGLDYGLDQSIAGLNTLISSTNTLLGTLNTSINTLDADLKALKNGWGSATTRLVDNTIIKADGADASLIAAPGVGSAIVVDSITVSIWSGTSYIIRGEVSVDIKDVGTTYKVITISPEKPTQQIIVVPGSVKLAANTALLGAATSIGGLDSITEQFININIDYHLE